MHWYLDRAEARTRRVRRDLFLRHIAEAVGVSVTQVSYWESGARPIAEERVADVVKAYGGPQKGLVVRREGAAQ